MAGNRVDACPAAGAAKRTPIFICGYPRSGTTLLRSVLSQHSRIRLVNEPEIIMALRRCGYGPSSQLSWEVRQGLLDKLAAASGACRTHLQQVSETVTAAFREVRGTLSFREVYERLLPRPEEPDVVWGEKSLNNIFFIRDILELYPSALMLHIVRDARSVALSKFRKWLEKLTARQPISPGGDHDPENIDWRRYGQFFAEQALRWNEWMRIARAAKESAPAGSLIEVKYEDFVAQPQEVLTSLCDAIGVAFESRMLDATARRADPVLHSSAAYAHRKLAEPIDQSRARAHEALPPPLTWLVERHARPMLETLGYPLLQPRVGLWQRWGLVLRETWTHARLRRGLAAEMAKRTMPSPERLAG